MIRFTLEKLDERNRNTRPNGVITAAATHGVAGICAESRNAGGAHRRGPLAYMVRVNCRRVLLPQPEGPRGAENSQLRETLSTATRSPKRRARLHSSS